MSDIQTTPEKREELHAGIVEGGTLPDSGECLALIHDAELAEHLASAIEAIQEAMYSVGYSLVDVTTDDNELPVYEVWTNAATDSDA